MDNFPDIEETEITEPTVTFTREDTDFVLEQVNKTVAWIERIIQGENCILHRITYIFCSDTYLHKINVKHLDHDTLTDIITFPYAAPPLIESDIFISIDRVRANAVEFEVAFDDELLRVIIHGVLHLCGYGDKTKAEAALMREKENEAVALYYEKN